MSSYFSSILLILTAISNVKAIDYASYRFNDTVSVDATRDTARTTLEIFEKLNNVKITSPESLQEGTEHLLQFGALLRSKILDTFGKLIYDHYDEFEYNEMKALYRIYQDTLERKYNIYDIVPNVLSNYDLGPLAICNYINLHVHTSLRTVSSFCTKTKFPKSIDELPNDTKPIDLIKLIYYSSQIDKNYKNGFTLSAILESLKNNHLEFTTELFSGLLHNIQYDDYDDDVRTAERELIHYFLKNSQHILQRSLIKSENIKQYNSISKLLKGFLQSNQFPNYIKLHAEYLAEHIRRESIGINENIELLGAAFEDGDINLKYLFELILPNDTIDSDVIDARNYLIHQMTRQNIVEKYLKIEKYQQSSPSQLLMGILGQLRDINFITDIATSLHVHARYWHATHTIENLNQLLELFNTYENLRGIPEYSRFIWTIDKLRRKLRNTNNVTIEISCTNPRKCLHIALKMISRCDGVDKDTKKLIDKFFDKSNLECDNNKNTDDVGKTTVDINESVSKEPLMTMTSKNSGQVTNQPEISQYPSSSLGTIIDETPHPTVIPTKNSNTDCSGEHCEEDDVLATGGDRTHSSISNDLNDTTQSSDWKLGSSTESQNHEHLDESTESDSTSHQTILNSQENSESDHCEGPACHKNISQVSELILKPTLSSELEKNISDSQTRLLDNSDSENTVPLSASTPQIPVTKITNTEMPLTTSETVVLTPRPVCQHQDSNYRQKLRRLEKINKYNTKTIHHDNLETSRDTESVGSTHSSSHENDNLKTISEMESSETLSHTGATIEMNKLTEAKAAVTNIEIDSATHSNVNLNLINKHKKIHSGSHEIHSHSNRHHHGASQNNTTSHGINEAAAGQNSYQQKIMQKYHESRQNLKNSRRTLSSKRNLKRTEKLSAILNKKKHHHKLQNEHEINNKLSEDKNVSSNNHSDSDVKNRLFDWNMPLFSNYDIAMNDKPPVDKKNYRSRRETINNTDEIKVRLFDINVPLFSNYDFALNDKAPVAKTNYRTRRESTENTNNEDIKARLVNFQVPTNHRSRRETQKNQTDETNKRLLDFNMPLVSNMDIKMNDKPPVDKTNYRSRRVESTNQSDQTNKRLLDFNMPLGSNYDIKMNDKPPVDKKNYRSRRVESTNKTGEIGKRLFDFNMPLGSNVDLKMNDKPPVDKKNYRTRREIEKTSNTQANARLLDINVPMGSNVDLSMNDKSPVDKKNYRSRRQVDKSNGNIHKRLFDINMPLGSNYNLKFNDDTVEKKNFRSRRDANVNTTINPTTIINNSSHVTTNLPSINDKNNSNINNNNNNTLSSTTMRNINDNRTITDSNTTEKIINTTVVKN